MTPSPPAAPDATPPDVPARPLVPRPPARGMARTLFSRTAGFIGLIGLLIAIFVMKPAGLGPSMCTLQKATGYPCPGCGLTRSVSSFAQGHPLWSFKFHPLGPPIAILFLATAVMAVLPNRPREAFLAWLEKYDRYLWWIVLAFFVLMIVYGLVRIVLVATGHPDYAWWLEGDGTEAPWLAPPPHPQP
ncbi:MAG: DUF2752 domain-containing protein [Sumerlaeia bacterium]